MSGPGHLSGFKLEYALRLKYDLRFTLRRACNLFELLKVISAKPSLHRRKCYRAVGARYTSCAYSQHGC